MTQTLAEFNIITDAYMTSVSYENPNLFDGFNLDTKLAEAARFVPSELSIPQNTPDKGIA